MSRATLQRIACPVLRATPTRFFAIPARSLATRASDTAAADESLAALGFDSTSQTDVTNSADLHTQSSVMPAPSSVAYDSRRPPILDLPPAQDPLLHYLTSSLTQHGHRSKASRIVARTLQHLHAFTRAPPLPILREAIFAAAPAVKTTSRRVGSKTNYKPVALQEKQRTRFAVQWILKASESKTGQTVEERLAREFIAVLQGTSEALKKKEEVHKFAMVNRGNVKVAFAGRT